MFRRPAQAATEVERDATDDRYFGLGGAHSRIGVTVTVTRARQIPVIRDCLKTLSDSVAGLGRGVFRRVAEGQVERAEAHPVSRLLDNPNRRQTGFEFIAQMIDDIEAEGDFFAVMEQNARGEVIGLQRLEPARTTVEETVDGTKRFRYRDKFGTTTIYLEGEIWHIPLPPLVDGIKGTSPILDDGLEAVAVAIALQEYSNSLFSNDATPPYAFSMEGNFASIDDKKNWLKAWKRFVGGANRHNPGLLEYGMKPQRLGLTAEEAQFLETRKELWHDLARIWRMPPHKVGLMDRATFNNIEHQSLEFVIDTLRPVLELIEASVNKFLIDDPEYYFEFNVSSLLRGDINARYQAYALGRQWGWLSVNDILRLENRNGIGPAGDRYMEPLNMVPVGTGAPQRDPEARAGIDRSIAFLRESVARNGGRPRLEVIDNAA